MDEVRADPQALRQIGGVKGNVLIVLVPVVAVVLLTIAWLQWRASDSGLWLGVIAVVLVASVLIWISRVKAIMRQARDVLGHHMAGSVGYGVGVVRNIRILGDDDDASHEDDAIGGEEPEGAVTDGADGPLRPTEDTTAEHLPDRAEMDDDAEEKDLSTVEVELTLSVSPVQGSRFTAVSLQRYATLDALRLETGQHGPVRYLRRTPETSTAVETRLEPESVQKIYRAAAMN
ncbi:hypothetical protein FCK90_13070 [Kocuria coralli]|uniref:Uncharacterized protein n=1 Tax=Kocuria coralli TaxID=1461025 RepID=A0A5J5KVQ0_9MICC|nr:hypothetical protein [Kocuria coralli]KAA9393310.1 hypothetical protein FCK90_13070 [Kocuria coralli]